MPVFEQVLVNAAKDFATGDLKSGYGNYLKAAVTLIHQLSEEVVFEAKDRVTPLPDHVYNLFTLSHKCLQTAEEIIRSQTIISPDTFLSTSFESELVVSRSDEENAILIETTLPLIPLSPLIQMSIIYSNSLASSSHKLALINHSKQSRTSESLHRLTEDVDIHRSNLDTVNTQIQSVTDVLITMWSPDAIAKQLTIIETQLFGQVVIPDDLIPSEVTSPSVQGCLDFHRYIESSFTHQIIAGSEVSTSISDTPDTPDTHRSNIIIHIIHTAYQLLHTYRNFNSFAGVVKALTNIEVLRLSKSWKLVPHKMKQMLNDLIMLTKSKENYTEYQLWLETILNQLDPGVPWMERHVHSIVHSINRNNEHDPLESMKILSRLQKIPPSSIKTQQGRKSLQNDLSLDLQHNGNDLGLHHWLLSRVFMNRYQLWEESVEYERLRKDEIIPKFMKDGQVVEVEVSGLIECEDTQEFTNIEDLTRFFPNEGEASVMSFEQIESVDDILTYLDQEVVEPIPAKIEEETEISTPNVNAFPSSPLSPLPSSLRIQNMTQNPTQEIEDIEDAWDNISIPSIDECDSKKPEIASPYLSETSLTDEHSLPQSSPFTYGDISEEKLMPLEKQVPTSSDFITSVDVESSFPFQPMNFSDNPWDSFLEGESSLGIHLPSVATNPHESSPHKEPENIHSTPKFSFIARSFDDDDLLDSTWMRLELPTSSYLPYSFSPSSVVSEIDDQAQHENLIEFDQHNIDLNKPTSAIPQVHELSEETYDLNYQEECEEQSANTISFKAEGDEEIIEDQEKLTRTESKVDVAEIADDACSESLEVISEDGDFVEISSLKSHQGPLVPSISNELDEAASLSSDGLPTEVVIAQSEKHIESLERTSLVQVAEEKNRHPEHSTNQEMLVTSDIEMERKPNQECNIDTPIGNANIKTLFFDNKPELPAFDFEGLPGEDLIHEDLGPFSDSHAVEELLTFDIENYNPSTAIVTQDEESCISEISIKDSEHLPEVNTEINQGNLDSEENRTGEQSEYASNTSISGYHEVNQSVESESESNPVLVEIPAIEYNIVDTSKAATNSELDCSTPLDVEMPTAEILQTLDEDDTDIPSNDVQIVDLLEFNDSKEPMIMNSVLDMESEPTKGLESFSESKLIPECIEETSSKEMEHLFKRELSSNDFDVRKSLFDIQYGELAQASLTLVDTSPPLEKLIGISDDIVGKAWSIHQIDAEMSSSLDQAHHNAYILSSKILENSNIETNKISMQEISQNTLSEDVLDPIILDDCDSNSDSKEISPFDDSFMITGEDLLDDPESIVQHEMLVADTSSRVNLIPGSVIPQLMEMLHQDVIENSKDESYAYLISDSEDEATDGEPLMEGPLGEREHLIDLDNHCDPVCDPVCDLVSASEVPLIMATTANDDDIPEDIDEQAISDASTQATADDLEKSDFELFFPEEIQHHNNIDTRVDNCIQESTSHTASDDDFQSSSSSIHSELALSEQIYEVLQSIEDVQNITSKIHCMSQISAQQCSNAPIEPSFASVDQGNFSLVPDNMDLDSEVDTVTTKWIEQVSNEDFDSEHDDIPVHFVSLDDLVDLNHTENANHLIFKSSNLDSEDVSLNVPTLDMQIESNHPVIDADSGSSSEPDDEEMLAASSTDSSDDDTETDEETEPDTEFENVPAKSISLEQFNEWKDCSCSSEDDMHGSSVSQSKSDIDQLLPKVGSDYELSDDNEFTEYLSLEQLVSLNQLVSDSDDSELYMDEGIPTDSDQRTQTILQDTLASLSPKNPARIKLTDLPQSLCSTDSDVPYVRMRSKRKPRKPRVKTEGPLSM